MARADVLLGLLIPALILLHLVAAPYTKVEESFNLQAVHDILKYGISFSNAKEHFTKYYDHFTFPGVVPRSFVGSLVLAEISRPFVKIVGDKVNPQIVVRSVLGLFNAYAIMIFKSGIKATFGPSVANWYLVLQASQFHTIFYASRTLPNTFAFGLTTLAFRNLLPNATNAQKRLGIYLLTVTGIIFRSEVALLLGTLVPYYTVTGKASFTRVILPAGIVGGLLGLAVTLGVDSFFWQSYVPGSPFTTPILEKYGLTWPEFSAFFFNVLQNKSAEWGVLPWHYYISNAIPKLLSNPISISILLPVAIFASEYSDEATDLLVPVGGFVLSFSALEHKEWRFIVYIAPVLTLISAIGASHIFERRFKHGFFAIGSLVLVASTIAAIAATAGLLLVSSANYPGGVAVNTLHSLLPRDTPIKIHLDVETCMTGASRFLQESPIQPILGSRASAPTTWKWDKEENEKVLASDEYWQSLDWTVGSRMPIGQWRTKEAIYGFAEVRFIKPGEKIDSATLLVGKRLGEIVDSLQKTVRSLTGGYTLAPAFREAIYIFRKDESLRWRAGGDPRAIEEAEKESEDW